MMPTVGLNGGVCPYTHRYTANTCDSDSIREEPIKRAAGGRASEVRPACRYSRDSRWPLCSRASKSRAVTGLLKR